MTIQVERHIGGEGGHRSFFGGTVPRARIAGLAIAFGMLLFLTPSIGVWGLVSALIVGGLTVLLTQRTHRGSYLERRTRRQRWKNRVARGVDAYMPFEPAEWERREEALRTATGRLEKWEARRALAAMRQNPDGADGLGWLQFGRHLPGIAWHAPVGEDPYLSVVFTVGGQLRGVEASAVMTRAADAWGKLLASRGGEGSLLREFQTMTRVLPADSAMQEFWVLNSLDTAAPEDAVRSYADVLRLTGDGAMVQRHYIVARWPLSTDFTEAAHRYGEGRDGWRGLMDQEIHSALSSLSGARLGNVEVLTARRAAAVIRHQQNPSRPIDFVSDVEPDALGEPSHDEFSANVVESIDPVSGQPVEWWHRTAAIRSENMAVGARTQLWTLDLLVGRGIQCVRSISFHIALVPAKHAKEAARRDLTRDMARALSEREAGRIGGDETTMNQSAAARRFTDLSAGSNHHGAGWVGFITISEPDRDSLMRSSRALEDVCTTGLGIDRLEWLDSEQAAASGTTWPIARGLAKAQTTLGMRAIATLAGTGEKEALT